MREVHYTPNEMFVSIDDRTRHAYTLFKFNKVPVVAYTTNNSGEMLFLYKKERYVGTIPVIEHGNPMYILTDITHQELIQNRDQYLFAHIDEVTIYDGNKTFKNTLNNL